MHFETLFEFNEQEFQLRIYNDSSYVYIQLILVDKVIIWSSIVELNTLVNKFNFLDGCFFQTEDLAEYLIFQVNNGEFRLENGDDESKILNLIFWIQKEKEDEIEQYDFFFSLSIDDQIEVEKEERILNEKNKEINDEEIDKTKKISNKILFIFFNFKIDFISSFFII